MGDRQRLNQNAARNRAAPGVRGGFAWAGIEQPTGMVFDGNHLYVAVRCHDSAGLAGISAFSLQRDQDNDSDDLVGIILDTFRRQSDGYYFGLSAAGGLTDGLVQDKDQANDDWDGLWHGRVTRDEITAPGFVKFYVRKRVGGKLRNTQAIKLLKISTT